MRKVLEDLNMISTVWRPIVDIRRMLYRGSSRKGLRRSTKGFDQKVFRVTMWNQLYLFNRIFIKLINFLLHVFCNHFQLLVRNIFFCFLQCNFTSTRSTESSRDVMIAARLITMWGSAEHVVTGGCWTDAVLGAVTGRGAYTRSPPWSLSCPGIFNCATRVINKSLSTTFFV